MSSKEPFFNWKNKLAILIVILIVFFVIFDIGSLSGINTTLQDSDIGNYHLQGIKRVLFNLYLLKLLRLALISATAFFIIYWILRPYRKLTEKIKNVARHDPQLKPLLKGNKDELIQADKILDAIIEKREGEQNKTE